jgi:hypothetical protein
MMFLSFHTVTKICPRKYTAYKEKQPQLDQKVAFKKGDKERFKYY